MDVVGSPWSDTPPSAHASLSELGELRRDNTKKSAVSRH